MEASGTARSPLGEECSAFDPLHGAGEKQACGGQRAVQLNTVHGPPMRKGRETTEQASLRKTSRRATAGVGPHWFLSSAPPASAPHHTITTTPPQEEVTLCFDTVRGRKTVDILTSRRLTFSQAEHPTVPVI